MKLNKYYLLLAFFLFGIQVNGFPQTKTRDFRFRTTEDLQAIDLSMLVVAGEHDVIKEAHTNYIYKNISNSRFEIMKGAGRSSPLRESNAFNKLVIEFLE